MELFNKHKTELLRIVVNSKTDTLSQLCTYLREQEPEITDEELLDCLEHVAATGITED